MPNQRELATEPRRPRPVLLRMVEPDGQLVAPMAFIPAAERYGPMPAVDRWVIAHACRERAHLRPRGTALPTCMINVSATSASDTSLADYISECLEENSLVARHLGVELTETAAIGNLSSAAQLMAPAYPGLPHGAGRLR